MVYPSSMKFECRTYLNMHARACAHTLLYI